MFGSSAIRFMNVFNDRFVDIGLFEWVPRVRSWFDDPSYILYLGLSSSDLLLNI